MFFGFKKQSRNYELLQLKYSAHLVEICHESHILHGAVAVRNARSEGDLLTFWPFMAFLKMVISILMLIRGRIVDMSAEAESTQLKQPEEETRKHKRDEEDEKKAAEGPDPKRKPDTSDAKESVEAKDGEGSESSSFSDEASDDDDEKDANETKRRRMMLLLVPTDPCSGGEALVLGRIIAVRPHRGSRRCTHIRVRSSSSWFTFSNMLSLSLKPKTASGGFGGAATGSPVPGRMLITHDCRVRIFWRRLHCSGQGSTGRPEHVQPACLWLRHAGKR